MATDKSEAPGNSQAPVSMDATKTPITVLLEHLFFHTPQGWTCLFFSLISFLAGVLSPHFPDIKAFSTGYFLIVYPLFLILGLLSFDSFNNRDNFAPSRLVAIFMAIAGVFPFVYPYIKVFLK